MTKTLLETLRWWLDVRMAGYTDAQYGKGEIRKAVEAATWRPMTEAPRDGSPFLVRTLPDGLKDERYNDLTFVAIRAGGAFGGFQMNDPDSTTIFDGMVFLGWMPIP